MNKHKLVLCLALLPAFINLNAQDQPPTNKNTVFLEAGGNSLYYSLNYDRILMDQPNWKVSGRLGLMYLNYFNDAEDELVGVPLEFSYLRGKKNNFLELGLGLSYLRLTYKPTELQKRNEAVALAMVRVGYRHQKPEGGLFFKAGFTPFGAMLFEHSHEEIPFHERETFALPWAGAAIGWTLKRKA